MPRILLAEDNPDSREITSLILSESGLEVVAAPTGREALALLEELPIDAVLLDNRLPDMSGIDVCHRIREVNPGLPIVFFSASAYEADKKKALECGAQAYIIKPDGLLILSETLQRLITQHHGRASSA